METRVYLKQKFEVHNIVDDAQLITGEGFKALKVGDEYLPFLSETEILEKFPNVMVDMGAVRFMCKGANVMRPVIQNSQNLVKEILFASKVTTQVSCNRKINCLKF